MDARQPRTLAHRARRRGAQQRGKIRRPGGVGAPRRGGHARGPLPGAGPAARWWRRCSPASTTASARPRCAREEVLRWAAETRCVSADERLIRPAPFAPWTNGAPSCAPPPRRGWPARCRRKPPPCWSATIRCASDLVRIPRIPRFSPWCGTCARSDWHRRFRAVVAVSGHLHVRRTDWRDGTRFEEVSLGYARQWD